MKESPLRQDFRDHRQEMVKRLERIESKVDKLDDELTDHKHGMYVTWPVLIPLVTALMVGALQFV